jgi:hypothetical protein
MKKIIIIFFIMVGVVNAGDIKKPNNDFVNTFKNNINQNGADLANPIKEPLGYNGSNTNPDNLKSDSKDFEEFMLKFLDVSDNDYVCKKVKEFKTQDRFLCMPTGQIYENAAVCNIDCFRPVACENDCKLINNCTETRVCPIDFIFNGTECVKRIDVSKRCPDGYDLFIDSCVKSYTTNICQWLYGNEYTYNNGVCQKSVTTSVSCPSGYSYDNSLGQCVQQVSTTLTCPSGYTSQNGTCVSVTITNPCPSGYTLNSSTGQCERTVTTSVNCPSGTTYNSTTGKCETSTVQCPSGTTYNNITKQCESNPTCPTGTTYNASTNKCESTSMSCPTGYTLQNGQCTKRVTTTPTCPSGYIVYNGQCAKEKESNVNKYHKVSVYDTFNSAWLNGINPISTETVYIPQFINPITTLVYFNAPPDSNIIEGAGTHAYIGLTYSLTLFTTSKVATVYNTITDVYAEISPSVGSGLFSTSLAGNVKVTNNGVIGYITFASGYMTYKWEYLGRYQGVDRFSCTGSSGTIPSKFGLSRKPNIGETVVLTPQICYHPYKNSTKYYKNYKIYVKRIDAFTYESWLDGYEQYKKTGVFPIETASTTCPSGYTKQNNECVSNDTVTPICPNGLTYDSSTAKCETTPLCPSNTSLNTTLDKCQATPTCSVGSFNVSTSKCESTNFSCPSGYTLQNGQCYKEEYVDNLCSGDSQLNNDTTIICPSGYIYNNGSCVQDRFTTPYCSQGMLVDGQCFYMDVKFPNCPSGYSYSGGGYCVKTENYLPTCPNGYKLYGNQCQKRTEIEGYQSCKLEGLSYAFLYDRYEQMIPLPTREIRINETYSTSQQCNYYADNNQPCQFQRLTNGGGSTVIFTSTMANIIGHPRGTYTINITNCNINVTESNQGFNNTIYNDEGEVIASPDTPLYNYSTFLPPFSSSSTNVVENLKKGTDINSFLLNNIDSEVSRNLLVVNNSRLEPVKTQIETDIPSCDGGSYSNAETVLGPKLYNGKCYVSLYEKNTGCDSGYTYNTNTAFCEKEVYTSPVCPTGYSLENGKCVGTATTNTITTTNIGSTPGYCVSTTSVSGTCPTGYYYVNGGCVKFNTTEGSCPTDYYFSGGSCYKKENKAGYCDYPNNWVQIGGTCYKMDTYSSAPTCSDGYLHGDGDNMCHRQLSIVPIYYYPCSSIQPPFGFNAYRTMSQCVESCSYAVCQNVTDSNGDTLTYSTVEDCQAGCPKTVCPVDNQNYGVESECTTNCRKPEACIGK